MSILSTKFLFFASHILEGGGGKVLSPPPHPGHTSGTEKYWL